MAAERLAKKTSAAQLRREVEARTGTRQNMKTFGFEAVKYRLTGEPTRFREKTARGEGGFFIQRTKDNMWRIGWQSGRPVAGLKGGEWYPESPVESPLFTGPVAAALWFEVEKSNGTIRFRQSQDAARTQ